MSKCFIVALPRSFEKCLQGGKIVLDECFYNQPRAVQHQQGAKERPSFVTGNSKDVLLILFNWPSAEGALLAGSKLGAVHSSGLQNLRSNEVERGGAVAKTGAMVTKDSLPGEFVAEMTNCELSKRVVFAGPIHNLEVQNLHQCQANSKKNTQKLL